ncbi:MAG: hypothetical protein RLT05_30370, partial [Bauldia litoralis]
RHSTSAKAASPRLPTAERARSGHSRQASVKDGKTSRNTQQADLYQEQLHMAIPGETIAFEQLPSRFLNPVECRGAHLARSVA